MVLTFSGQPGAQLGHALANLLHLVRDLDDLLLCLDARGAVQFSYKLCELLLERLQLFPDSFVLGFLLGRWLR